MAMYGTPPTAYDICSEVYGLSGFGIPSAFFQSGDPDDRLIFFLLRNVARDIAKYRWQTLVQRGETTISPNQTEYNLPLDFREMIPNSVKTVGDLRAVDFPSNFDTWSQIDAQIGINGTQHRLRFQEDKLTTLIGDTEGYTIRYNYISNYPVIGNTYRDVGGGRIIDIPDSPKPYFTEDIDTWRLDQDLIVKALKAKWSIEKGLDTVQADIADYNSFLLSLQGTQAHSQKIRMGGASPYAPSAPWTNLWK